MKQELDKTYNPSETEDNIYQKWEKSGFFNPDNLDLPKNAPAYTIILPPPNITAKLHIGHSAMLAIEDLLIRYRRLSGFRTLWVPGTDHAAIATQSVVEKKILKEQGKTRNDLGRETFLAEVWKFVNETQATILHQTKKMGSSLDWSRLAFTLDETRQKAVARMFIDMYQEGVIYRGERIVNWCPRCHSTLADDEVEYKEQTAKLYIFKYSLDFPIAISTTRPETKLGDTAVAVNPKDERYHRYIGKQYKVNFCGQELNIRIIADYNVDSEFGTGALGVTPAHSAIDWQMAQANSLPIIKVINEAGLIRDGFGVYSGLRAVAARDLIVAKLQEQGLLEKEEEINNNLSVCYRCETAIEPLPSKQWFIGIDKKLERLGGKSLKEKALEAADKKKIIFIPERFNKNYCDWMNNLHDWCISRQIWFGHQIPVWYKGEEIFVGTEMPSGTGWVQDPDTLDTWFSSGMWTFSTLGWPDNFKDGVKSGDLKRFHPTQVLETGYEILTLWISRMIMMSFFALGEIPFSTVYLHGTILDKQGKKMSKSKGNGVDPVEAIGQYGADAVRLSLLMGSTPGNDTRYSDDKVESKRNFVNKLWNISRFILSAADEKFYATAYQTAPIAPTLADKWILNNLAASAKTVTEHLENFNFSLAAEELNEFTWNKLADWYLEIAKIEKNKEEILIYILKNVLILWHPFIPFVTEKIWSNFNADLLMVAKWPQNIAAKLAIDEAVAACQKFQKIQDLVIAIRNVRGENKVEPAKKLEAVIYGHEDSGLLKEQAEIIINLKTGLKSLEIKDSGVKIDKAIATVVGGWEVYLLGGANEKKEKERLAKEKENLEKIIGLQSAKLGNADFVDHAPEEIVAAAKSKLAAYRAELEKIVKIIQDL